MKETEPTQDHPTLFETRQFLGRTVFIIGNLIQPDFSLDDEE